MKNMKKLLLLLKQVYIIQKMFMTKNVMNNS